MLPTFRGGVIPLADWLVLTSAVLLAGCNQESIGKVAGKVTLAGRPLSAGSIVFDNQVAGISVRANLGPEGTYQVRTHDKAGLPPGNYRVAVTPSVVGNGETPLAGKPLPEAPPALIPVKYHDVKTSGLTADVQAGQNQSFDFALVK